jgi:hypothetical protein
MGINRVCVFWKRETAKEFFKMKKNTRFVTGMLAILLVFGLVLGGCPTKADDDDNKTDNSSSNNKSDNSSNNKSDSDNDKSDSDNDSNPFIGNWSGTAVFGEESASATVKVTSSGWAFKCTDAGIDESGTYTRSGSTATLKQDGTTFGTATISSGTLTVAITSGDYQGGSGTFTK